MEKLNNYYKELPSGFGEAYCIDAKKSSVGVILNVIALAVAAALIASIYLLKFGAKFYFDVEGASFWLAILVFALSCFLYIILHELTHGLAYKISTRQKLRFGMTLTVAYCGLKEGYVNKKTALFSVLAPFVLFSVLLIPFIIFLPQNVWALVVILLFSIHASGCVGDLWVSAVLIFKFRKTLVLMCDDGPTQRFYTLSDC